MAVDKQLLEQCIIEAAGDDADLAKALRDKLNANDALAAKFVGGFMRTSDYTKKTQELAGQRQQFEAGSAELANVRKALEAAETEKGAIMKELAGHRISTAKARELMKLLQEKYQLTDEDLPGMSDLIETSKKGKPVDTTEDLDSRFAKFGEKLMADMEKRFVTALTPELGAMANLPLVWNEITREHEELTGKRLTFSEQQEILKAARDSNRPLRDVWEEKFGISGDAGLRMQKRDEKLKAGWTTERETAEAAARSKAALEVVTPTQADLGTGPGISLAFKTKFKEFPMDPNAQPGQQQQQQGKDGTPTLVAQPGQHVRQAGNRGPTGAQRAAAKYLEQMNKGGYGKKAS
jgi:hypothetical protein